MKRGLEWYKREQRAILDSIRAARMTDRQAAIYNIVLDLIYDGGGETPDDPKHVASYLANVGTAAARATIQQLVDMGKLTRRDDMLHQRRAENEAKTRENLSKTRAEIGRLGGVSSGFSRRQSNENNEIAEANASSKREAEKEKSSVSKDTGHSPPSLSEEIWSRGVAYLTRNGVAEKQARSLIGRWRKDHGEQAVFEALSAASRAGAAEPVAFITATLKPKADNADQKLEAWGIGDAKPLRVVPGNRDLGPEGDAGTPDLPRMLAPAEGGAQAHQVPVGDANGGWGGGPLPSLQLVCGGAL